MARCSALRLVARDHVAVGELAKRRRDLLAALRVNGAIRADRFHGYHLAIYEAADFVVHPNEKLVALRDFQVASCANVEALSILFGIEEVTAGQFHKVAFNTFHWITARLLQAREMDNRRHKQARSYLEEISQVALLLCRPLETVNRIDLNGLPELSLGLEPITNLPRQGEVLFPCGSHADDLRALFAVF